MFSVPSFGSSFGSGASSELDQPSTSSSVVGARPKTAVFGSQPKPAAHSSSYPAGKVPTFGQPTAPPAGVPGRQKLESGKSIPVSAYLRQNSLSTPPAGSTQRPVISHRNITVPPSQAVLENYESLLDLPPELQGVSVKDLVKALGEH